MRIPLTFVLAALLATPLAAHQPHQAGARPAAADKASEIQRLQLVREGHAALAAGQAGAAEELFERAGNLAHEADAEIGQVRAMMQAGAYRRALAFAAHTAGVHPEDSVGAALYAWLLYLGGQARVADDTLARALAHHPGDAGLIALRERLARRDAGKPVAPPGAPGPFGPASPAAGMLPATAQVVASAVLIEDGKIALAPATAIGGASRAWVRDGLGRISSAAIMRTDHPAGLLRLRLDAPLPSAADQDTLPERNPFPGSPAFVVGYAARGTRDSAWPLLRAGFLGMPAGVPGHYALGIAVSDGMRGGAVFDSNGTLVGVVVPDQAGEARIAMPSVLREHGLGATPRPTARGRMPVDEIYERAMARVVQVLVAP